MITEKIYINRNNINKIRFKKAGSYYPLDAITKIDLVIEELNLTITNSIADEYPLKWEHDPEVEGLLELQIGTYESEDDPPIGLSEGTFIGKLYIYSTDYPDGFFWAKLELEVDY